MENTTVRGINFIASPINTKDLFLEIKSGKRGIERVNATQRANGQIVVYYFTVIFSQNTYQQYLN